MRASPSSVLFAVSLLGGLAALACAFEPQSESQPGQLQIVSEPPGATVSIDGVELGKAPLTQFPKAGPHKLSFRLEGYANQEVSLSWKPGGSQAVHQRLKAEDGTLSVRDLNKARLHLGPGIPQELKGPGPWKLAPGKYELTAVRDRLPAKPKRIEIKPGQALEVALDWPALPVMPPQRPELKRPAGTAIALPPNSGYLPPRPAYLAPRYNSYQPTRPAYHPAPLFTPIPPSRYDPPPPRTYPGTGDPIFTPLP
jgi:hypothetical protein